MGLLDSFKSMRENRTKKSVEKYGDTLKNPVTTKEQRLEAIEALERAEPTLAVPQLLKRFEIIIDHGIQDNREKEQVLELLVGFSDVSRPLVKQAVLSQKRVAWPIKTAERIFEKEEFVVLLLEAVKSEFVGFDESVQERNIELLLALKEIQDERIVTRIGPLVKSRDEHVRIAALECLEAQAEVSPEARRVIVSLVKEASQDDNARFLGLVKNIIGRHNWA